MEIERRYSDTATTLGGESRLNFGVGTIVGYAAVFYDGTAQTEFVMGERMKERIMPGAFRDAIKNDDVRALFNHNPELLLGRNKAGTLTLREDSHGLRYTINPGDTTVANDVREHLRRGDLSGSSFGFRVTDDKWEVTSDCAVRVIRAVRLLDVGPVTFPAYHAATAGLRSISEGWLGTLNAKYLALAALET